MRTCVCVCVYANAFIALRDINVYATDADNIRKLDLKTGAVRIRLHLVSRPPSPSTG